MDFMQRIGGRKFLMTLMVIGLAVVLDIKTEKGLTATMAGFLATLVGSFHVANTVMSGKFMDSKAKPVPPAPPVNPVSQDMMDQGVKMLQDIQGRIGVLENAVQTSAQTLVTHANVLQQIQRRG